MQSKSVDQVLFLSCGVPIHILSFCVVKQLDILKINEGSKSPWLALQ